MGGPCLDFQTWEPQPYTYDSRSTPMTTAAICATREVSWRPSFYRGEQSDSDLGLYYLRARYYNPATGRFLSRDPLDGNAKEPASLHKYLYAGGDPVNHIDPRGKGIIEWLGTIGVSVEMTEAWVTSYMLWCSEMMTEMLYPGEMAADFEPAYLQDLVTALMSF